MVVEDYVNVRLVVCPMIRLLFIYITLRFQSSNLSAVANFESACKYMCFKIVLCSTFCSSLVKKRSCVKGVFLVRYT